MATSATEICNYALAMAQSTFVDDISVDTSEAARQCLALYPLVRDAVLRVHPWNCAVKRVVLNKNLTAPPFEFDYSYSLPSDYLRALTLYGSDFRFEVEGGNLLTNDPEAKLLYIAQNLDVSSYDALLVEAIEVKLASKLAAVLNVSRNHMQMLDQQYRIVLNEARMINGQEGSIKKMVQRNGQVDSRHGYKIGKQPFRGNR